MASLLGRLNAHGEEARIVGGAVRDILMGRSIGDIDIATTVTPEQVMAMAKRHGWKVVPTGIDHGTVTVIIGGAPFEVTTLRRDVATDGRRAVVAFSRDFREDAFRRDFTINALSLSLDGKVHDYATGLADAKAGIVRFMGDAETRIREDYLRILRFFRFHASHGEGPPEARAFSACAALKGGMAGLSRERVRQELLKLLVARRAVETAEAMQEAGLWPFLLPGIGISIIGFRNLASDEAALGLMPDAILRLAALTDAVPPQDMLRLSKRDHARLAAAQAFAPEAAAPEMTGGSMRSLIFRASSDGFQDALKLAAAHNGHGAGWIEARLKQAKPYLEHPPVNPFSSADVMARGVPIGPRMGQVLKAATRLWIEAGLPDDRESQQILLGEAVTRLTGAAAS